MKKEELRIGNWYQSVKWGVPVRCDLTDLYNLSANADGADDDPPIDEMFAPILLTEEWLKKLGFKPLKNDFQMKGLIIHKRKRGFIVRRSIQQLFYVHQLQNLYFALTGSELEIQ